jgi:hypothetical protein
MSQANFTPWDEVPVINAVAQLQYAWIGRRKFTTAEGWVISSTA